MTSRTLLAHHWFFEPRGGERLLAELAGLFPAAPILTAFAATDVSCWPEEIAGLAPRVRPSRLQPLFRASQSVPGLMPALLPLLPWGIRHSFRRELAAADRLLVSDAGLAKTLEMLREGDTLVVWKLDRLGRSVKQLVDLVGELHKQGVQFRSLTDSIDTGTPSGRFFFHVMASLAEMERELTVERTRAGLAVAKQLGRKGGRKPKMTDSKIESAKKLLASGVPPRDVAKNLGVSIPTLYRWVPASLQI